MNTTCQDIVDAILAEVPGVEVHENDYGNTVRVFNPATKRALYVQRVFRDKDPVDVWMAHRDSLPKMIERLREPQE